MAAVEIDACKTGWIAVALRDRAEAEAYFLPAIEDLSTAIPDAEAGLGHRHPALEGGGESVLVAKT